MNSRRIVAWLPVILWMSVIFFASTEAGSPKRTSRIIGPILRWIKPDISPETISNVQHVIRKGAHLFEYGVLAVLVWLARRFEKKNWKEWSWREARYIVAFCAVYAVTDELHQQFVSSRHASPVDVGIDTMGAAAALLAIWLLGRWRKLW